MKNHLNLIPKNYVIYLYKGDILQMQKKYIEAIQSYDILLNLSINYKPLHARLYHSKATALLALERTQEALTCCEESIKLSSPQDNIAVVYFTRGNTLLALNRLEEAIADYDKALQMDPDLIIAKKKEGNCVNIFKEQ